MSETETLLDPQLLEQLPTIPDIAVAFVRMCEDPDAGARDVAALAQGDPALLARILQVANSPFYAPREPVTDVARASAILGLRSLKMIGVGFAILGDLWASTSRSNALSSVIGASAMAGAAARTFSVRVGTGRDEEAYTSGLLAFVGELALLRCYEEGFVALWDDAGHLPDLASQREHFGADGVVVGRALMDRWGIPAGLDSAIEVRERALDLRMERSAPVYDAALGFGTAVAELMTGDEQVLDRLAGPARTWGFSEREMMEFWSEFRASVRQANQQLGVDVGRELDRVIVGAREEYLSSAVRASSALDAAQREIDALKAENTRLLELSLEDPLTGIPNRAAFDRMLRSSLASKARGESERLVAVAMFDLDHFKRVNDTMGHVVGDQLLQAMASAAHGAVRANELFARLGGDEFAMVLRPASIDEIEVGTERIRRAMVEGSQGLTGANSVTVTAGAAVVEQVGEDIDATAVEVLRSADDALYAAKRTGRDRSLVTAPMTVDEVGEVT